MHHLADVVNDHGRRWLTKADILNGFDRLAQRVPSGYMEVRHTDTFGPFDAGGWSLGIVVLRNPLVVMRGWLGEQPSDAQITVAAMAVSARGTPADVAWWSKVKPGDASRHHWENALRLLTISRWKD